MKLSPYIFFNGSCEEALHFYQSVFGGEITDLNRYEGAPMQVPDDYRQKVMHAALEWEGNTLQCADAMPGQAFTTANNFSLSVSMMEVMHMDEVFSRLAEGGNITMPLQDTFWGARFGMLIDRFGIQWMFNCDLN